ncbi:hypothetical protein PRBEI_2000766200 [Prionailurus iriomotensis]
MNVETKAQRKSLTCHTASEGLKQDQNPVCHGGFVNGPCFPAGSEPRCE